MDIIVCVKQIVDLKQLRIHRESRQPLTSGLPLVLSDIDKNALEEAVRLKEKLGQVTITVLSLGGGRLRETIKEALAMGGDQAILLTDPALHDGGAALTALALAAAVRKLGSYDLVLLGEGSADNYSGQVGPRLAALLDLPDITYVRQIELEGATLRATRALEDGLEVVQAKLPAMVTVLAEINEPRIPALPHILRAGRKPVQEWSAADLGLAAEQVKAAAGAVRQVSNLAPLQQRKGVIFSGPAEETAGKLADALRKEGVIQ